MLVAPTIILEFVRGYNFLIHTYDVKQTNIVALNDHTLPLTFDVAGTVMKRHRVKKPHAGEYYKVGDFFCAGL